MSSRRKIQARRKGQRQEAAARTRGLIPVRVPEIQERVNYTAELMPLALYRPNLSVNGLREVLEAARDVDSTLSKVYLNIRDIRHLAVSLDKRLVYSSEMRAAVSRALGVTVQEHRGIPKGGAVLAYLWGRAEYIAPNTSKEKS